MVKLLKCSTNNSKVYGSNPVRSETIYVENFYSKTSKTAVRWQKKCKHTADDNNSDFVDVISTQEFSCLHSAQTKFPSSDRKLYWQQYFSILLSSPVYHKCLQNTGEFSFSMYVVKNVNMWLVHQVFCFRSLMKFWQC